MKELELNHRILTIVSEEEVGAGSVPAIEENGTANLAANTPNNEDQASVDSEAENSSAETTSASSGIKQLLDYNRDIEPIITKYGLENDNECKKAVELIKKDDPLGYNLLARILIFIGVNDQEGKIVYAMTEKAFKMGFKMAYYNLGSQNLFGVGVNMNAVKGLKMMNAAFLVPFSEVYNKYPLGSAESDLLCDYLNKFMYEMMLCLDAANNIDEGEMRKSYRHLTELYTTILDINDNGF